MRNHILTKDPTNDPQLILYGYQPGETPPEDENSEDHDYHTGKISAFDISANRTTVVTGEISPTPSIHIWNVSNGQNIAGYNLPEGSVGVSLCSISPCCRYVATVDLSSQQNVGIYDLEEHKDLLTQSFTSDKIIDMAWSKNIRETKQESKPRFATITTRKITYWHPNEETKGQ